MPINDTQYQAWLADDDAIRCILVEADNNNGSEQTEYLSTKVYFDSSLGRVYKPIVNGSSIQVVERVSLSSNSFLSFGDIEINNQDGSRDGWLDYIWTNRAVKVLIGDVNWIRSDFRTIFNGIIEDIDSANRGVLNLKVRDKLQRLNMPLTENKLGGATKNKDELLPLCFGEVHNITPLLTNPSTLEYQVHDGAIEDIIEVRDNGVPVSFTKNLLDGKFTLNQSPFGRITASVQGYKPATWINTIGDLIKTLTTSYGDTNNRFALSDIDVTQVDAFNAANPSPLGTHKSTRDTVLNVCNKLARSIGAQLVMSREGLLKLIQVTLPATGTPIEITQNDIIEDTLQIAEKVIIKSAIKLGFAKNLTVQDNLETGIPAEHKELYKQEWLTVKREDAAVKSAYKIESEPKQIDTMLLRETDAIAEADRLLNIYKVPRFVFSFVTRAKFLNTNLGDTVTLTHPRFNLDQGKTGVVIGLSTSWQNSRVRMEVLI
ncbi:hypothetical protein [uncultured Paraglaciecola sp.]|uniref:hypothetical protein n=1 Tax=uncultured Paraglaciecola sp. TaxID=1765024 RepID=UPI00261A54BC|nr:hypothetical protein [uncultured Paraglaciecola sp.]